MVKKYHFLIFAGFFFGFNISASKEEYEKLKQQKLQTLRLVFEKNRKNFKENSDKFINAANDYIKYVLSDNVSVRLDQQSNYFYFVLTKNNKRFQPSDLLRLSWQEMGEKNPHRNRDILKNEALRKGIGNLYKIHLTVGCDPSKVIKKIQAPTKNGADKTPEPIAIPLFTWYASNTAEGTDILFTLIKLMVESPLFRACVEAFKFNPNFTVKKDESLGNISPIFVIYPYSGQENAQLALDTLCKTLEPVFKKAASKNYTYLTPRYSIGLDDKRFPGIFYTQGDASMKNFYWSSIVFDESTGLALFNPYYVLAESTDKLKLKVPA